MTLDPVAWDRHPGMTPTPLPSLTSPRATYPGIPGPTATAASLDTPPDRLPAPEAAPYFSLPLFLGARLLEPFCSNSDSTPSEPLGEGDQAEVTSPGFLAEPQPAVPLVAR